MNTPPSIEEIRAMLPVYALGALDERERALVRSYLERHPELRDEAATYGIVTYGLAAGVPPHTPPPALRAALLNRARPAPAPAPVQQRARAWDRLIQAALAPKFAVYAACATLLLIAGLLAVQVVRLGSRVAFLEAEAATQARLAYILANGSEQVALRGIEQTPEATATLHYIPGARWAALKVNRLPNLPTAQAYQLWLTNAAGERWSGATFTTDDAGQAIVLVWCPQPMDEIVRFRVSIEPAQGSPEPTGPGVLLGVRS